jgi:hypothetical protein
MENKLVNVWYGDSDGREALNHKITCLDERTKFIKWIKSPLYSFTRPDQSFGNVDESNENYNKLPDYIKEATGNVVFD